MISTRMRVAESKKTRIHEDDRVEGFVDVLVVERKKINKDEAGRGAEGFANVFVVEREFQ